MPALLIRHKIGDYATWAPVFAKDAATRRANGARDGRLFQSADDPNEVLVLIEWDDLERARLFADSDDLREAMNRSGVTDHPDIWFLEDVGRTAG